MPRGAMPAGINIAALKQMETVLKADTTVSKELDLKSISS